MPRLELNATVLLVKMACLLKKELKLEEIKEMALGRQQGSHRLHQK